MVYTQSLDYCLSGNMNKNGLKETELLEASKKIELAMSQFKRLVLNEELPAFSITENNDDLQGLSKLKDQFLRGMTDVFVLGTGGSSLGAQALAQLTGWRIPGTVLTGKPGEPRFHFFDNLDPKSFELALRCQNLKTTAVLVISKSGGTSETLMQFMCVLDAFEKAGLDWNLNHHVLAITMPDNGQKNALRSLCGIHDIPILDHDPNIGGRFSVLSNVGLIPASLMGLDVSAVRRGAANVLSSLMKADSLETCEPAMGAVVQLTYAQKRGRHISALLSYSDQLKSFGEWYIQLWAESLGKGGQGTTPLSSIGPVFQHSQLQMFLDGPEDKVFTIIMDQVAGMGLHVPERLAKDSLLGYLSNKYMGDLVDCQQRATAETLAKNGQPVRVISLERLDEEVMGALFMHFMIETTLTGFALELNVFDQPAVEEGKTLARSYLASM